MSIALSVAEDPAPAMTRIRPAATSTHSATTRLCSSKVSEALSPVVPIGTTP